MGCPGPGLGIFGYLILKNGWLAHLAGFRSAMAGSLKSPWSHWTSPSDFTSERNVSWEEKMAYIWSSILFLLLASSLSSAVLLQHNNNPGNLFQTPDPTHSTENQYQSSGANGQNFFGHGRYYFIWILKYFYEIFL